LGFGSWISVEVNTTGRILNLFRFFQRYLHQELALMEKEAGNLEQAREYFERGTRYAPRSAALWQAWALLEADAEDTDKARELFEKAR
jgi:tetratricopeptide (TPR) repeat protein